MHPFRLACRRSRVAIAAGPSPSRRVHDRHVWSFGFGPKPIRLAAGQPVTLNFVNRSGSGHDFTAHSFFASARIVSGAAPDGEIELAGHATRSITLIPRAGSYNAHCSHFLHKQMGMSDEIIVNYFFFSALNPLRTFVRKLNSPHDVECAHDWRMSRRRLLQIGALATAGSFAGGAVAWGNAPGAPEALAEFGYGAVSIGQRRA